MSFLAIQLATNQRNLFPQILLTAIPLFVPRQFARPFIPTILPTLERSSLLAYPYAIPRRCSFCWRPGRCHRRPFQRPSYPYPCRPIPSCLNLRLSLILSRLSSFLLLRLQRGPASEAAEAAVDKASCRLHVRGEQNCSCRVRQNIKMEATRNSGWETGERRTILSYCERPYTTVRIAIIATTIVPSPI